MGDATGGGRLETKGRERKNNDVTRSTTRKRTINSPTCIFDGPKRTLFYTPTDGGIKDGRKRRRENSKYDVTQGHERGKRTMTSLACIFDEPAHPLVYTPRGAGRKGAGKRLRETQNMTSHGHQRVNAQ